MNTHFAHFKIKVNEKIYVKDPETSGRSRQKNIKKSSILLIDELI
jgi:hypothetical protein